MKSSVRLILALLALVLSAHTANAQCSTTVSFDEWLSGSQSENQEQELSGAVTSITFNLNFIGPWGVWPSDMIVVIYSPNGNCIGGEGFNINPTIYVLDIEFPPIGLYLQTMGFTPTLFICQQTI